jgi:hypothetical protein
MAATRQEISRWFDDGVAEYATHMIIVCDTFDMDDFPIYVYRGWHVHEVVKEEESKTMQKVMEVYALHLSKDMQLNEFRAHHYEYPPVT